MSLVAFHGKEETKQFYINRIQDHVKADELVQGEGWDGTNGCHVGCILNKYDHGAFPEELGWPIWVARLIDRLHEGQTKEDAVEFFLKFTPSVKTGMTEAQFEIVKAKFFHWLLVDEAVGIIRHAKTDRTKASIQSVADLYALVISGEEVSKDQWRAAAAYAAAAADAAAYAAAADAAAYADAADAADAAYAAAYAAAADADADAAAAAYAYAADAAAAADAYASNKARQLHFKRMADKLIQLFEEVEV